MRNKLVRLLCLSLVGGTILTGCSGMTPKDTSKVSKEDVEEIKTAIKELKTNSDYLIQNTIESPDGTGSYLEVVHDGGSYTEYPVDEEGVVTDATLMDEDSAGTYALSDWIDADGSMFLVYQDNENNSGYYSLPQSYGKDMLSRNVGFVDEMVDNFTSIEQEEKELSLDGSSSEKYTLYRCTLPAEVIKKILGSTTYGLYSNYAESEETDKGVKDLCEYYLEDLDMSLTFSDANVSLAVADGNLRQVVIEVGGLGTRMYVTKTFIMDGEYEIRERPDFSKALDYEESMKEIADFVEDYDSYDEAMEALRAQSATDTEETEGTDNATDTSENAENAENSGESSGTDSASAE